ncbi:MAG: hypothetical protein FIB08_03405 [Candidatus Methanoperedens sp.]|nr:hypothetical protein [Candidatus Methanoperedens sp.]
MNYKNYKKLPTGVILSLITGILLILIAPEDRELGQILKLIYLHGALVNTGLFLFSAVGLLSLASLFRNSPGFFLLFAIEKTAIIFWVAATVTGNITSWLAWGGIFWGEPRLQAMITISLISISIYLISSASENPRTISFLGIGLALSVWILIVRAGRIMHPDNPFSISEYSIRLFFIVITLVFLVTSILAIRWQYPDIVKKKKN